MLAGSDWLRWLVASAAVGRREKLSIVVAVLGPKGDLGQNGVSYQRLDVSNCRRPGENRQLCFIARLSRIMFMQITKYDNSIFKIYLSCTPKVGLLFIFTQFSRF